VERWLGDAKDKRLPAGGCRNANLYQLLAYSIALDLPGGTLVYAADDVVSVEHIVVECGKQLRVVALDLTSPGRRSLSRLVRLTLSSDLTRAAAVTTAGSVTTVPML
jgi:hypothetical protein